MRSTYQAIVLGASAGGMSVIKQLVTGLPEAFHLPVVIVQHIGPGSNRFWVDLLNEEVTISVKEADEKEVLQPGTVYMAPPDYHLLIERDYTFSLTIDEHVNYARPSIDVLFETAADAYKDCLIGIVLTGGNFDGAHGLKCIHEKGGLTIVQDPITAEVPTMPYAAINMVDPDYILSVEEIIDLLKTIHSTKTSLTP